MKKIFTLIAATALTVASFAADRKPSVTLKTSRNYEVVIDGRSYSGNGAIMEISLMRAGQHSIKVYEQKRAGFGFFNLRSKKLVDASTFMVGRNDVDISIDFRGQINIKEDRFGKDKWNDHDNDYGHDKGRDNDKDGHGKRF